MFINGYFEKFDKKLISLKKFHKGKKYGKNRRQNKTVKIFR